MVGLVEFLARIFLLSANLLSTIISQGSRMSRNFLKIPTFVRFLNYFLTFLKQNLSKSLDWLGFSLLSENISIVVPLKKLNEV